MWIELPIRRPRRRQPAQPPSPSTSRLSAQPVTWELVLLQQLLAEPEIQALLSAGKQTLDMGVMQRWSRAKHGDPATVEQFLRAHVRWRAEFVPGGSIPEASTATCAARHTSVCEGSTTAVVL